MCNFDPKIWIFEAKSQFLVLESRVLSTGHITSIPGATTFPLGPPLCTCEYSRLFVARSSLQITHELYTFYTHNTCVVWSETSTKTKKSQNRVLGSGQVPPWGCVHNFVYGEVLLSQNAWRLWMVSGARGSPRRCCGLDTPHPLSLVICVVDI